MKQLFTLITILLCSFNTIAQDSVMINKLEYSTLIAHPHFKLDNNKATPVLSDDEKQTFQDALRQHKIIVFLGTWCSDSQERVPEFLNFLAYLDFPKENIEFFGLNEQKESDISIEKDYQIEFVPTFIFKDITTDKETFRIIEQFEDQDILKSFSKALSIQ